MIFPSLAPHGVLELLRVFYTMIATVQVNLLRAKRTRRGAGLSWRLTMKLEQDTGFEPVVVRVCNPVPWASRAILHDTGAAKGNRTLVLSLEGCGSAIEL
jgi:hypothetical protein